MHVPTRAACAQVCTYASSKMDELQHVLLWAKKLCAALPRTHHGPRPPLTRRAVAACCGSQALEREHAKDLSKASCSGCLTLSLTLALALALALT